MKTEDEINVMACKHASNFPSQYEERKNAFIAGCNSIQQQAKNCNAPDVMQQRELFVSFARFVQNYKHSYGVAYEEMFSEWLKKKQIVHNSETTPEGA